MPPSRIWLLVIPGSVLLGLLFACCEPQASNAIDPAASSAATRRVPIITLLRLNCDPRSIERGGQGFNNRRGRSSSDLISFGRCGLQSARDLPGFAAAPAQHQPPPPQQSGDAVGRQEADHDQPSAERQVGLGVARLLLSPGPPDHAPRAETRAPEV